MRNGLHQQCSRSPQGEIGLRCCEPIEDVEQTIVATLQATEFEELTSVNTERPAFGDAGPDTHRQCSFGKRTGVVELSSSEGERRFHCQRSPPSDGLVQRSVGVPNRQDRTVEKKLVTTLDGRHRQRRTCEMGRLVVACGGGTFE